MFQAALFVCLYRHYQLMLRRREAANQPPLEPAYDTDCNSCMMIHVGEKACNNGYCPECGAIPHRLKE